MNTLHAMDERDLDPDPLRQFQRWFDQARDAGILAPESMALATSTAGGRPSVRMVLLKRADVSGFDFHTNYESRKGGELEANPHAALLFHWQPLGRQVRVEGKVERVPAEESEAYFRSRPLGSRLAAWASPQSRPLADRVELERLYADAATRFPGEAQAARRLPSGRERKYVSDSSAGTRSTLPSTRTCRPSGCQWKRSAA